MKTEPIFTRARVPCSNQDHGTGRLGQDKSVGERNNNLEYAWAVLILKKNGIMILFVQAFASHFHGTRAFAAVERTALPSKLILKWESNNLSRKEYYKKAKWLEAECPLLVQ